MFDPSSAPIICILFCFGQVYRKGLEEEYQLEECEQLEAKIASLKAEIAEDSKESVASLRRQRAIAGLEDKNEEAEISTKVLNLKLEEYLASISDFTEPLQVCTKEDRHAAFLCPLSPTAPLTLTMCFCYRLYRKKLAIPRKTFPMR